MDKTSDSIGFFGHLTIKKIRDGKVVDTIGPIKNKVVSGTGGYGRNLIIRQLAGDTTYNIEIDSVRLGDGTTPPADSDTNLGNVLVTGVSITNMVVANNVLTIDVFLSDGNLPNDTYSEMGFFINGRLFSRILITPSYTKASGEDTLFTYTLTATG